nr:defensin-7-like [Dasypus novemcinctus]
MKVLTVLSAVVLLAFLTHAEPFRKRVEEQPEAQDHDMAISFLGDERGTQEATGPQQRMDCSCRFLRCRFGERNSGPCSGFPLRVRCCR